MDPASAIGIASFGIQVCQGLLSYYDGWKGYKGDIEEARDAIAHLRGIFEVLESSLKRQALQQEQTQIVEECLISCKDGLNKLEEKLKKLQGFHVSEGLRRKAYAEIQHVWYPLYPRTISKLRKLVSDLQSRLSLALGVLHLNQGAKAQQSLVNVQTTLDGVTSGVRSLRVDLKTGLDTVATGVQDLRLDMTAGLDSVATGMRNLELRQDSEKFQKLLQWLNPPDPWFNHVAARRHHEPKTGEWVLHSKLYIDWKTGGIHHLTLKGKAGCGKTIITSTVIEDIQQHCGARQNLGFAVFYFSFTDKRKQSFDDLVLSLISQLGDNDKALSMLQREHDRDKQRLSGTEVLLKILSACIQEYESIFLILDALDECPESDDTRMELLNGLAQLCQQEQRIRTFTTARPLRDIEDCMDTIQAAVMPVSSASVDSDIARWVERQLHRDRRLSNLDESMKREIMDTFAQKSDGMFRWAYCQLEDLKKLPSTKPKYIRNALATLPKSLDETYERMLLRINDVLKEEALILLWWLAYARRPLTLLELAETTIIDPTNGGSVDFGGRGSVYDTLEILEGLVTLDGSDGHGSEEDEGEDSEYEDSEHEDNEHGGNEHEHNQYHRAHQNYETMNDDLGSLDTGNIKEHARHDGDISSSAPEYYGDPDRRNAAFTAMGSDTLDKVSYRRKTGPSAGARVRLAHYSLREFLENDRILRGRAGYFHLEITKGDEFLGRACLTYLTQYTASPEKSYSTRDFMNFPLLHYAKQYWGDHTRLADTSDVALPVSFLCDHATRADWYSLELSSPRNFRRYDRPASALFYASDLGLVAVVHALLQNGHDANAEGDGSMTCLQAALYGGHERVAEMLIVAGADVNAEAGLYGTPLERASELGLERVVGLLIREGARVNEIGDIGDTSALRAASKESHERVVEILLREGADPNAELDSESSPLYEASFAGHERIVELLIAAGADVNGEENDYGETALHVASRWGYERVVERLIAAGAGVDTRNGFAETALHLASDEGHEKVVKTLISAGAKVDVDVDADVEPSFFMRPSLLAYEFPLVLAVHNRHAEVAKILLGAGADLDRALEHCDAVDREVLERLAAEVVAEKELTESGPSSEAP